VHGREDVCREVSGWVKILYSAHQIPVQDRGTLTKDPLMNKVLISAWNYHLYELSEISGKLNYEILSCGEQ